MKLSKSKLALAKIINENGGWRNNAAIAIFGKYSMECAFVHEREGKVKYNSKTGSWQISNENYLGGFKMKPFANWHQTILGREEYYHAYPKDDADGWIEWKGGECPVDVDLTVYVNYRDGGKTPTAAKAGSQRWDHSGLGGDIMRYSLHNLAVKHEFCESVTRSIPEPEEKPTIEQLARDYRNKIDYANSKRQEADEAKAAADAALGELKRAGEVLGLVIDIANPCPGLVITDWRDLLVNDVIFVGEYDDCESGEYVVIELEGIDYGYDYAVKAAGMDGNERWIDTTKEWRFIRRP